MDEIYQCPLCGYKFKKTSEICLICPLVKKCDFIMCPNCYYEFPKIPVKQDKNVKEPQVTG
ncbi:MAG: hypothetical protein ACTSSJ_00180 [Candidatus Odinarchaeia archaeon]